MWFMLHAALALEPATCPPAEALLPSERWLRAASLDIRGVIPSEDEYLQISSANELPEALIDGWLETDEFAHRVARHHRSLLWPGFDSTRFVNNRFRVALSGGIYRSRSRDNFYRGAPNTGCGDFEATYTDGELNIVEGEEGWVWVHPYWEEDPSVMVKVCALDAQDLAVSTNGVECDTAVATNERACGCGPNLDYCIPPNVLVDLRQSLKDSVDERIESLINRDGAYTELLTEQQVFMNGPLVHFFKHQSNTPAGVRIDLPPVDLDTLPNIPYQQTEFVQIPTHSGHSGLLTDTSFLVRFMTNRARVNQFYNSFLCQPFTAPPGGISGLDVENPTLDLANRDGCRYCHALLEPETAYWARWTEGGAGYLDPAVHPAFDADCEHCSVTSEPCDPVCTRYYTVNPISDELDAFVGSLSAMQFLPEDEYHRVDEGPNALVQRSIADGKLQTCVTQKAGEWLLGRPLTAEDEDAQQAWTSSFVGNAWDYKQLVKTIVLSESYRRAR